MRVHVLLASTLILTFTASARTWRVEKDGSGDFTVIQDAVDAAVSGDSVLVGSGRFDDFREQTYLPSGPQIMTIIYVAKTDLTILGSGFESTFVGPDSLVSDIGGMNAAGVLIEPGSRTYFAGVAIENMRFPVNVRQQSRIENCRITNADTNWGLTIIEGDSVQVINCAFLGPKAVLTSSSAVTNAHVDRCTFEDSSRSGLAIGIGNGATGALISRCAIVGYAGGVQTSLGGSVVIEDTQFMQVRVTAIDLSSGSITMRRCRIDAGGRYCVLTGQGTVDIYDSVLAGGSYATIVAFDGVYIRNSHILNAGTLSVDAMGTAIQASDLRENWWGTTDLAQISAWINQPNNNVLYEPILEAPVSTQTETIGGLKARFGESGGG